MSRKAGPSFYADLHIHSKYSRATSKSSNLEELSLAASRKGISVIGTGDFTHPAWIREIEEKLVPAEPGLYRLRDDLAKEFGSVKFMLQVEISTIYKKGDFTRKVHHLIYAPQIEKAQRIIQELSKIGNLHSDGRPILGLDSRNLLEIVLEAGSGCFLIPAHIWTPWFSAMGSKSGFDSIDECYDDLAPHIFAIETGLSSDPPMNWQLSSLDRFRLVSNSDAHSPSKLGREACVFDTPIDYFAILNALQTGQGYVGTVEFFPEEGKYHMDGHRKCGVRLSPQETDAHEGLCPQCGKPVVKGVMYRVSQLADRAEGSRSKQAGIFSSLIPLQEIISEIVGVGPTSKTVQKIMLEVLDKLGPELPLLLEVPLGDIEQEGPPLLAEAIGRMRKGQVIRSPGYDGEYGQIRLFSDKELRTPT